MSGVVERIVQQARESKERRGAVLASFLALPLGDRREVLAEMIIHVEAEEDSTAEPSPVVPFTPPSRVPTWVDRAETYVLAHPEGVKTADVGKAIGQDASSVDGTLRQAMKRGNIKRDQGLWWPVGSGTAAAETSGPAETPGEVPRPRTTIRDVIRHVYAANGNSPLGAAALFGDLLKLDPEINRSSVDGEMNRMRKEKLLVQVGVGPNSGGIYKLTEGSTGKP